MKTTEKEQCRQSQITTINIFDFTFCIKNHILLEGIVWKKTVYTIIFYRQFLRVAGYLKCSNNTPNLKKHKYTNYNIIEIYINRLITTTQVLIAVDYLILMLEMCLHFRKKTKVSGKEFFSHTVEVTGYMYFGNIFQSICISKICTKLWKKLK